MMFPFLNIKAKTVHMQKADGEVKRQAFIKNKLNQDLINKETLSRKTAYKNTSIKTGESFFDDSDMLSDYFLVVIYHKRLNIPLLTARYYYDKTVIANCLKGDNENEKNNFHINLAESKLFLSDRLSGNINSPVYRRYRNYIFLLFYIEILLHNKDSQFILMARKEKYDKLLKKYLQIGLTLIGANMHKGKEHWILLGDVQTCETKLKLTLITKLLLIYKKLIFKLTH